MQPTDTPAEYLEFILLFNGRKFFEAHEILERRWRQEQGELRDYYQRLIQIAAAFVHLQKGTPEGGKELLKSAAKYLGKYRPAFMGLDLEKLFVESRACLFEGREFPRLSLRPQQRDRDSWMK